MGSQRVKGASTYDPKRRVNGLRGLENRTGWNVCFINAVLQCMSSTKFILKALNHSLKNGSFINQRPMTSAVCMLLDDLSDVKNEDLCSPEFVIEVLKSVWPKYTHGVQQDCQEFLLKVIEVIHGECLDVAAHATGKEWKTVLEAACGSWQYRPKSSVAFLLQMQKVRSSECSTVGCTFLSVTCGEPDLTLTLCPTKDSVTCSLKECIAEYCSGAVQEDWCCPKCKQKECVKTIMKFGRLPPVLVVHISRFQQDERGHFRKNCVEVDFDLELDMGPFTVYGLQTNTVYSLKAVTNHHGTLLDSGHYTAYCMRSEDASNRRWYNFDDKYISTITERRIITNSAYLLWYSLKVEGSGDLPFDSETVRLVKDNEFPAFEHLSVDEVQRMQQDATDQTSPVKTNAECDPSSATEINEISFPPEELISSPPKSKNLPDQQGSIIPNTEQQAHVDSRSPQLHGLEVANILNPGASLEALPKGCQSDQANLNRPGLDVEDLTSATGTKSESFLDQQSSTIPNMDQQTDVEPGTPQLDALQIAHIFNPGISNEANCQWEHPKLKRPAIDLDVEDPILLPEDVGGPHLDEGNVDAASLADLNTWLRQRKLPMKGVKAELIKRVKNHLKMGKGAKINQALEGGTIHKRKRAKMMESNSATTQIPIIPAGMSVWKPFPSVHIPKNFNLFKIIDYYEDIPPCDFSYREGVVATLHEISDSLLSDSECDSEDERAREKIHNMTFQDLCRKAVKKCIKKGEQFLNSGRVLKVLDVRRGMHYFVKAQVQASMSLSVYIVYIIFHYDSGDIIQATCCCKTQELHRCGHIAAVLLLIWRHVSVKGLQAVTTTDVPCYWKISKTGRDPGDVSEKQYPARKRKIDRRNKSDPRPSAFANENAIPFDKLRKIHKSLINKNPSSLHSFHLGAYLDGTGNDLEGIPEDIAEVGTECSRLLWKINKKCEGKEEPFEVPNTRGQADNPVWCEERDELATSSDSRQFIGLSKPKAKVKYLRSKIWKKKTKRCYNFEYGKHWESHARKQYEADVRKIDPTFTITETGLWKNPKYPTLGCSPDGFITFLTALAVILLEIKVWMKAHIDPNKFDKHLSKEQLARFYLYRNASGHIELKKNHAYYWQIQMSLDILELEWCHLLVFSESGYTIVPVRRDPEFWHEKRARIIEKHRTLIVPERVLKRTLRRLPPIELAYPSFHEEASDDYFNIK